ncbi:hypothetical protein DH2020_024141 [Rehmannia glutinosa]|uniref:Uncharacterized protein n=1 Tax=Rehmannia glutinosa TaxID=99300 RepID=A0ABR0WAA8_REHGL
MRTIKKKSKRSNYSSVNMRHHSEKLQKQIILSRCAKNVAEGLPGLRLGRDDLVSLVDQSDDTEDYCNSEDLRRATAISPLLASTVESWDATTASFNDADDEVDDHLDLPGRQGCGIPCYWSRRSTPKSRVGYGSCCSPSLSDTLRRKGSSIFCGTQSIHQRRRHRTSLVSNKRRIVGQSLVPLLTNSGNGRGGSSVGSGNSDDEISTNFGELDLEALSRLDGRRWSSSCRSQEGLEIVALNGEVNEESSPENVRSLSHKYRPMFFEELIGQNIVVQSLMSAISRGRVAPVYLFQGPRGTGKTSTARIFAAALNCLATEENKPCGVCRECADFVSGKNGNIREFKVFVVEECHLLPSKTWLTFLRLLEKPPPHVVFVLITTDIDNVPRTILSRCQKHLFNKISNAEIVARLRKIAADENLDVESDALELIASNADGSLRDAETMVDQLSLFGKRISVSLVNELIGVVSDEKLLELLELAMSSNATETVIRARELMDSGVDPIVLMSQMATLIVDIIAELTKVLMESMILSLVAETCRARIRQTEARTDASLRGRKTSESFGERSTWFTATLLQLGSVPSPDRTHSGSSRRQSSKTTEDDRASILRETTTALKPRTDHAHLVSEKSVHRNSTSKDKSCLANGTASFNSNPGQIQFLGDEPSMASQDDGKSGRAALRCINSKMLMNIWLQCIEKCHSKTLRQLLHSHGRLVSVSEVKEQKAFSAASPTHSKSFLRHNVEVKMILLPDSMNLENKTRSNIAAGNSDLDSRQMEPFLPTPKNPNTGASKESKSEIPVKRIESIIHEQRLETGDGAYPPNEFEPLDSVDVPSQHWEDELNHEIKALKINDGVAPHQKDQIARRVDHYPISPSLLHNSSFASNFSKDNIDNILKAADNDLDIEDRIWIGEPVAVECSAGTITDLQEVERTRLSKGLLYGHAKAVDFHGSESVQNQEEAAGTVVDDRKTTDVRCFGRCFVFD